MNAFREMKLLTENQKCEFAQTLEAALLPAGVKEKWAAHEAVGKVCEDDFDILCDHDFANTSRILSEMGLSESADQILDFFEENGGYCDCEVILNVIVGDEEVDNELVS